MLREIITQKIVTEKLEYEMLKFIIRLKAWMFPPLDAARMREGFYRAFRG